MAKDKVTLRVIRANAISGPNGKMLEVGHVFEASDFPTGLKGKVEVLAAVAEADDLDDEGPDAEITLETLDGMTKAQLIAFIDERGGEAPNKATRDELLDMAVDLL